MDKHNNKKNNYMNILNEILGYINEVRVKKYILSTKRNLNQVSSFSDGLIIKAKEPITINFKTIKKAEELNSKLVLTLRNGVVIKISTINNDLEITIPSMNT